MPSAGSGPMLKLAMVGDGGVGKTALVIQLCLNKFVETYDPTIEDSYRKRILLDEHATTLELMDTAGQEEYAGLRDQWIREGEGFLLVYSVTQRASFTRIKQYYHEISTMRDGEPFGAVLVGNKIDQVRERQVSTQEGEQLAHSWGIPFFETSAKMNINAEMTFLALARLTRDTRGTPEDHAHRNDSLPDSSYQGGQPDNQNSVQQQSSREPSVLNGDANKLVANSEPQSDTPAMLEESAASEGTRVNPTVGSSSKAYNSSDRQVSASKKESKKKSKKSKCVVM